MRPTLQHEGSEKTLEIEGMSCSSCARRVEEALRNTPGVTEATVNLVSGKALVRGEASFEVLKKAVETVGYEVRKPYGRGPRPDPYPQEEESAINRQRLNLLLAIVLVL